MNRSQAKQLVAGAMKLFTAAPISGPNEDPPIPVLTGNREDPACFVTWDFGDSDGVPMTFDQTMENFVEVTVEIWVEDNSGGFLFDEHADTIEGLLLAAETGEFSIIASKSEAAGFDAAMVMRSYTWTFRRIG